MNGDLPFVSVKKNEFVGTFEGFESDPVTIPHIRYLTQPVKVNRQLTNDPFCPAREFCCFCVFISEIFEFPYFDTSFNGDFFSSNFPLPSLDVTSPAKADVEKRLHNHLVNRRIT